MARVAVVVVLEGPDAVTDRQTASGAVLAVIQALRDGAVVDNGKYGIWLTAEYINGEKVEYQVFGVEDVNTMVHGRALSITVTDVLFRADEKGTGE